MTSRPGADDRQVLIVGTGLIGASVGLALTHAGVRVFLFDTDPTAVQTANIRGAGLPLSSTDEPDIVLIAVPPRSVAGVATSWMQRYPQATVTDVTSVKAAPLAALRALNSDTSRFVGGHPMAGRETSGPESARADLFEDRLWIVAGEPENSAARVDDVRWLARKCGALVIDLSPDAHDRAVALTSHTPQLVASVLAAQFADADPADVAVSGQGVRDTTRLAASDPDLWSDILAGNAAEVAVVVRRIQEQLGVVVDALIETDKQGAQNGDVLGEAIDPVRAMLVKGNRGQQVLPDKHGGAAHTYEMIPVVVDDRPGQLAKLLATAGDAGVNLEDVRILHTVGRQTAVIELLVTPAAAAPLRAALALGDWQVRG